jgi:DNA modification methylase
MQSKKRMLDIGHTRICNCQKNHINCLTAKEWIRAQVAIQEFYYEGRNIRDKNIHPAVFPINLPKHFIKLFTLEGELILASFANIDTFLMAVRGLNRNAVGFDLKKEYIDFASNRLNKTSLGTTQQILINDDALNIPNYLEEKSVFLSITSPPHANMPNHPRKNKSIRGDKRNNEHFETIQQYSADPRDLGIMKPEGHSDSLTKIYKGIYPLVKKKGHLVINVNDVWENNKRYTTHVYVMHAIEKACFEFRNTIIWDKRKPMNNAGIFGWSSNCIALGTTMEFIMDFLKMGVNS